MQSEKVPYYILDLLQQVPSVFVQGLGRFDAIFHPAVIDLQSSRIKPPHIQADFVPDVNSETEILPAYMHYVSGIELNAAKDVIHAFVRDVLSRIQNGDAYSIDKFGTFSKSSLDVLHFTPDWDAFNLSFNGLEEVDLHPQPVIISSPVYEKPVVKIPETEEKSWRQSPEELIETSDKIELPIEESLTPVAEEIKSNGHTGINESTTRLAWIILTTSLILITALCAYLAWDIISDRKRINALAEHQPDTLASTTPVESAVNADTSTGTTNTTIVPAENTDSIIKQPVDEQKEEKPKVINPPVEKPIVRHEKDSLCFIVVGAFSSKENVDKMVVRIEGLGYTSELIPGTLTRVAISTSCEKENLQRVLSEARSSINPEAWIY